MYFWDLDKRLILCPPNHVVKPLNKTNRVSEKQIKVQEIMGNLFVVKSCLLHNDIVWTSKNIVFHRNVDFSISSFLT